MIENWMLKKLNEDISEKRYIHSIGVMETCVKLAKTYGVDEGKAELAGLLHDCAKYKEKRNLLKMTIDFGIILDNVMKYNTKLIHGPLGAEVARRTYLVNDEEILNAIKIHTTGKENMNLLEKIVFIADYIEPNREFEGVKEIRQLAFKDLNESIIKAMDNTIKYVIDGGSLLHLDTVKARNYLKLEKNLE
ncbi:bis(5'-nucleosyl)-tetraphosphatase (symmetrical) YqeK [Anaerosalibacter sp. Marseille-P3206]|uniref:bis(5'-nucleosyl)-tetraphosphatase (symmetrical) YqeK n=1 Tax=Anaerosalibacter sp. Marseille-P3206 TaxID=1871005 RepID=UPI0009853B8A|nr:bis(5'-nucleosyl)-tetraphosphatase (symmetrical) YqeK [Anaerosalibacter sp. Marseille-P3206]